MKLAALGLLAPVLFAVGCSHPQPVYYGPPPPAITPAAVYQQGFHDGFEAARHDVAQGRPPVFNNHPRFRNPPVPPPAIGDYRHGFGDGYNRFLHPGPGAPPPAYGTNRP